MTRVLVVDDEALIRDLLKHFLETKNYTVITASDGREAIERLSESPDLILLDVKMPEMSGLQVLKKIKEMAPSTGVVMVTGLAEQEIAVACVNAGAYDYITKPIDMKHLDTVIELYLIQASTEEKPAEDSESIAEDTSSEAIEESAEEEEETTDIHNGPQSIEKRKCRRFQVSGASGKIKKAGLPMILKGFSKTYPVWDISKGGLTFSCSESLKKGQKIIFQLLIPGEPVLDLGSIVRRVGQPDSNGNRLCSINFDPFGNSKNNNPVEVLNILRKLDEKYGD